MRRDRLVALNVHRQGYHSGPPAPFPGKHPTRIEYVIHWNEPRRGMRYFGKPSRMAIKRLEKLLNATPRPASVYFAEVDTKNLLALFDATARNMDRFANFYECWRIYHPWHAGRHGWEWLLSQWYLKRIKTTKGVMTVYSPMEQLTKEHLLTFKQMVDNLPPWPSEGNRGRA